MPDQYEQGFGEEIFYQQERKKLLGERPNGYTELVVPGVDCLT